METIADMFINQGREQGLKEGLKAGREEGLKAGLKEGQALALLRQLRARFGELPPKIVKRVTSAKLEQLESWADRVLVASTLDEFFAPR